MFIGEVSTTEWSEPVIAELIENRAEYGLEDVDASDVVKHFAVPGLVYDPRGRATQLMVIAGGAASGKSTLAGEMAQHIADHGTTSAIISTDDYVRWGRQERHRREAKGMPPEAKYDFDTLRKTIGAICTNRTAGQTIEVPKYNSHTGLALDGDDWRVIPPVDVLIVEGDMLGEQGAQPYDLYPDNAYNPVALYVHAPDKVRLARRIGRDLVERNAQGAAPQDITNSFERRQFTQHLPYTLTYAETADVILTLPEGDSPYGSATNYNAHIM
jgi:uridine kinase